MKHHAGKAVAPEKKLKIAEVVPNMFCGGVRPFVVNLCNELCLDHEVTLFVIMPSAGGRGFLTELSPEVKVVMLERDCSTFLRALCAIPAVCRAIRRLKPDVVHCHLEAFRAVIPLMIANFRRIPFLYTVHNDPGYDARRYVRLHRFLFRLPHVYPVIIYPDAASKFFRLFHCKAHLIVNGNNGQLPLPEEVERARREFSQWKTTPRSLVVLNLARVSKQKNQVVLAKAVKSLADKGTDIDLVIMGPEDPGGVIAGQIRELHCPRVHLVGMRTNALPYLALADALVLPSLYEGMPIAILEAFFLGIPCCVSARGGMKDMIRHGDNGLVCTETDLSGVEEMLREFCALPADVREKMGRRARESFAGYSMKECAQNYLRLMRDAQGAFDR